jgi:hypothetical protein
MANGLNARSNPIGTFSFSDPSADVTIAKAKIRTLSINGNSADFSGPTASTRRSTTSCLVAILLPVWWMDQAGNLYGTTYDYFGDVFKLTLDGYSPFFITLLVAAMGPVPPIT